MPDADTAQREFHLPDLGEGLKEAEIVAWNVAEGDHVVEDQPLLSVETDKAVVEIPSPRSGHVARLHGDVGDRIEVGTLLVEFAGARADTGAVVGELKRARAPAATKTEPHALRASPAVRRLARELGVDLAEVHGSGPDDTIVTADVERAAHAGQGEGAETLRGVRRAMFARMAEAHAKVVAATVTGEADVHAWPAGEKPLPRLIRAVGVACAREPRLNAAFDEASMSLRRQSTVDLGIAMETEEGLFVPVLRNVTDRSADDLGAAVERMKEDVQARTIAPDELRGQTITLSNFGAVGGVHASMIVVPPQVAIVGAGRMAERAVAVEGDVVAHRVIPLSLTFDHRVITGVEATRFLAALIADLEQEE